MPAQHCTSPPVLAMRLKRLDLYPGALFLLVMVTFIVTYCIAVGFGHVEAGFPYISETGSIPPESCIFSQFINIAAFLLLLCVYVRYLQLKLVLQRLKKDVLPPSFNRTACIFGSISCIGLSVVANFQESNVLLVHLLGAFACFFCGTIYFCLQTHMSRKLLSHVSTLAVYASRLAIAVLCIGLTISCIVCGVWALQKFNGENVRKWRPEHDGFGLHLASTISEWLLVIFFCGFMVSFSREFRGLVLEGPYLQVSEEVDEESL